MVRQFIFTIACLLITTSFCFAQKEKTPPVIDTSFTDYDELFSELDALIDSLSAPRSFTLFNVSAGQNFLNYESKAKTTSEAKRQIVLAPSLGYYDQSGFGAAVGASLVHDGKGMNPYQFSVTGAYDYQQNKSFVTGASVTHYFTKGNLPFYTSPLQNELYGYFTYRKPWFKPSAALSYAWGSRDDFEEVEEQIQEINLTRNGFTRINTKESVLDINLVTSVRHDFYFLNVLSHNDYVRLTPQLSFASGTQQFGFNQTSNTFATIRRTGNNVLYSTENVTFDDRLYFQPISITAYLKTEYAIGKFFLSPQLLLDYYFPATENKLTSAFVLNAGLLF